MFLKINNTYHNLNRVIKQTEIYIIHILDIYDQKASFKMTMLLVATLAFGFASGQLNKKRGK